MDSFCIQTSSPEETTELAEKLVKFLKKGDVVLLTGDLAAGKTLFVKSVVSALGSQAVVSSPTYTIAHHYQTDACPVLHIDAYRLSGPGEFRDLTLDDFYDDSLTLIEWGDIVETVFPDYLRLEFHFSDSSKTARDIRLSCKGQKWQSQFEEIAAKLGVSS